MNMTDAWQSSSGSAVINFTSRLKLLTTLNELKQSQIPKPDVG